MVGPFGNPYKRPLFNREQVAKNAHLEYQLFAEDYFSASDVNLFFGNIWVDEIISIQFELQEQVYPIYGYHSYTFDHVMRGKRMITGMFRINYKNNGYLRSVLKYADQISSYFQEKQYGSKYSPADLTKKKLDDLLALEGYASFHELAKQFENALWSTNTGGSEYASHQSRPFFNQSNRGFDIRIQYGAKSELTENIQINGMNKDLISQHTPNTTVETINGVQITGFAKENIETNRDGVVITERYSFIAKDINASLVID